MKGEVCHDGDEVKLFQDVILRDSVEINTAPKSIFDYLLHIMSMRKHMKEEGENLKRALESRFPRGAYP